MNDVANSVVSAILGWLKFNGYHSVGVIVENIESSYVLVRIFSAEAAAMGVRVASNSRVPTDLTVNEIVNLLQSQHQMGLLKVFCLIGYRAPPSLDRRNLSLLNLSLFTFESLLAFRREFSEPRMATMLEAADCVGMLGSDFLWTAISGPSPTSPSYPFALKARIVQPAVMCGFGDFSSTPEFQRMVQAYNALPNRFVF